MSALLKNMFEGNKISVAIQYDNDPKYWLENDKIASKEDFINYYELSGNVILYPQDDDCWGFNCGPEIDDGYLSDTVDIDPILKEIVRGSEYEECFDFGAAENCHEIEESELPLGKTVEDAYNFFKERLIRYNNVVLSDDNGDDDNE